MMSNEKLELLATIEDLEIEVKRLEGLLDEIDDVSTSEQCACHNIDLDGGYCAVCLELAPAIIEILAKRTASREKGGREDG